LPDHVVTRAAIRRNAASGQPLTTVTNSFIGEIVTRVLLIFSNLV
jgi:hypothetical protein